MVFLTVHGTFLRIDAGGRLIHVVFDALGGAADLLAVDIPADLGGTRFARLVADDRRVVAVTLEDGPLTGCVVRLAPDKRTAGILRDGLHYCAVPGEPALQADRDRQAEWETFLCLEPEDFAALSVVLAHDWVTASSGTRVRRSRIRLDDLWTLHLDSVAVPLRNNLPLAAEPDRSAPRAITVLTGAGGIERFHLYRPLVVIGAVGCDAAAALCVASLFGRGRFDGHLHALSDRPVEELAAEWGVGGRHVTVQPVAAPDAAGRAAAKFAVAEWPLLSDFQPVLVIDPDIMFDHDVEPLLCAVAAAPGLAAIPASAARGRIAPGLVGIPAFPAHAAAWRLLTTLVEQAVTQGGRQAAAPDREATDRLAAWGGFDTATLRRFVRDGWPGTEADPDRRLGALHFWPHPDPEDRRRAMADYADCLRTADAARQGLASKRPMNDA